ncbi:MAG: YbhB/YbcL family Raf kinase inhibitor-like protein [Ignavibacteriaceae bacterium]
MLLIFPLFRSKASQLIISILVLCLIVSFHISSQTKSNNKKMEIKLFSSAFKQGNFIPAKFSCEGANISPQLHWSNAPKDVKSFAIIVDDPDAPGGDFVHWVIYNIPGNLNELHEDVTPSRNIPDEVKLGTNGFGRISYGGPCPPAGKPHRYFFKIYALDTVLHHLESGATKQELLSAMNNHILAEGHLMGKYQRQ